jgi:uncharacterized protein (TIGR00303 family)
MWVTNYRNYSGTASNLKKRYHNIKHPLFLLVLSNTEIATVPGISGAGSIGRIQHTPAADAEIVSHGRLKTIEVMSDAPSGAVTPAVLTRAALNLSRCAHLLVNSGLQIVPGVPYYDLRTQHGYDIRIKPGVPDAGMIRIASRKLAARCDCDLAVIGETIPGGTTTALCVLHALGYGTHVSSSFSANPVALKEEIVGKAMKSASIDVGSLRKDPMRAITLFGDPMMPCVIGLVEGFVSLGKDVILAGGTQMGAVAAVLKELNVHGGIAIVTTKYVFDDASARFGNLIDSLRIDAFSAYPNFSRSAVRALQYYERGEVKEGVGAGGAMALACLSGYSQAAYRREVEAVVKQLQQVSIRK